MGRGKLTKNDVKEILVLAKGHWKKSAIARKFHVGHSAIIYQLNKHKPVIVRVKIPQQNFGRRIDDVIGEDVKTYQDYLDDEQLRIIEKQRKCEHKDCVEIIRCKCCSKVTYEDIL